MWPTTTTLSKRARTSQGLSESGLALLGRPFDPTSSQVHHPHPQPRPPPLPSSCSESHYPLPEPFAIPGAPSQAVGRPAGGAAGEQEREQSRLGVSESRPGTGLNCCLLHAPCVCLISLICSQQFHNRQLATTHRYNRPLLFIFPLVTRIIIFPTRHHISHKHCHCPARPLLVPSTHCPKHVSLYPRQSSPPTPARRHHTHTH